MSHFISRDCWRDITGGKGFASSFSCAHFCADFCSTCLVPRSYSSGSFQHQVPMVCPASPEPGSCRVVRRRVIPPLGSFVALLQVRYLLTNNFPWSTRERQLPESRFPTNSPRVAPQGLFWHPVRTVPSAVGSRSQSWSVERGGGVGTLPWVIFSALWVRTAPYTRYTVFFRVLFTSHQWKRHCSNLLLELVIFYIKFSLFKLLHDFSLLIICILIKSSYTYLY